MSDVKCIKSKSSLNLTFFFIKNKTLSFEEFSNKCHNISFTDATSYYFSIRKFVLKKLLVIFS